MNANSNYVVCSTKKNQYVSHVASNQLMEIIFIHYFDTSRKYCGKLAIIQSELTDKYLSFYSFIFAFIYVAQ